MSEVSRDERTAVQLLASIVRAAKKRDCDPAIKSRAERAGEWLSEYGRRHPENILRDESPSPE